jgi:peptide/nickel transport system substrate-binding protein
VNVEHGRQNRTRHRGPRVFEPGGIAFEEGQMTDSDAGRKFDARMSAYLRDLRGQAMSRRGFLQASSAAAAAAAVTATVPFVTPAVSVLAQVGGTFTFGLEGDVRGLEPALAYDFTANPVVCQISEGLMMFTPEGGLQPLLAASYDHPDALTYIYKLRQGINFQDGAPVTIEDVVASIARVRDPNVAGPMAWMYDPVATIETPDETTLKVTLSAPSALYQFVAATTAGHVIPKAAIEKYGLDLLRNPIGTGPFKFVKWDSGDQIVLEKNPNYWQAGLPAFDKAIFKIVPEGTTRITGLKNGDLNAITQVPPDQIETVKAMDTVAWQEVVGYTINLAAMRTDSPPFDDIKVRQAVAMAIPYKDIMANIVKETGVQSHNTTVPSNMPGSAEDQLAEPVYDLVQAKALLAQSSQPNGFSFKYNVIAPNDVWIPMAVAIQQALKELNIDMSIEQLAYADMITLQQAGNYTGMMSFQWGSDFPDASGMLLPLFHSKNFPPQNNHAYYKNPDVDKMLDEAEAEQSADKRKQLLVDIQKQIATDQPALFFEHYKWFMPMSKNITGYTVTPLWYWDGFCRNLKAS